MQRSGYISKKIALATAEEVRRQLLKAYACAWECSTDKRGTKWFYQIDLMENGKRTGLALGPNFPEGYIAFIANSSHTDCIEGNDPVALVATILARLLDPSTSQYASDNADPGRAAVMSAEHSRLAGIVGV